MRRQTDSNDRASAGAALPPARIGAALAVLAQLWLGSPVMLRELAVMQEMADPAICGAAGTDRRVPPAAPAQHCGHCVLCQIPAGPSGTSAAPVELPAPPAAATPRLAGSAVAAPGAAWNAAHLPRGPPIAG